MTQYVSDLGNPASHEKRGLGPNGSPTTEDYNTTRGGTQAKAAGFAFSGSPHTKHRKTVSGTMAHPYHKKKHLTAGRTLKTSGRGLPAVTSRQTHPEVEDAKQAAKGAEERRLVELDAEVERIRAKKLPIGVMRRGRIVQFISKGFKIGHWRPVDGKLMVAGRVRGAFHSLETAVGEVRKALENGE